ncbi:MAG: inorganic pyrophosphatase [Clostridia bacterium]|nr:inorganic pyrophosphatase [Clostridia bacterium]
MNKNEKFWQLLDKLVEKHRIVVDRPKGSCHPRYEDYIYPLDYGYLDGSHSSDNVEVDVWLGTSSDRRVRGIISSVDILKSDVEVKLLFACTDEEMDLIMQHHNRSENTVGILTARED